MGRPLVTEKCLDSWLMNLHILPLICPSINITMLKNMNIPKECVQTIDLALGKSHRKIESSDIR